MRLAPHNSSNRLTRRERRQRLMAMCVLAYVGPLFMADPQNVDNWVRAFCLDSARAAMFTPTETNQTVTYAYDDNGNLVTETVDDGSGPELSKLYAYDAQNRLIYVDPSPADSVQTDIVRYFYDANGARVMRSKNGSTTRYVLDRNTAYAQVLEEWNVAAEPWVAGADKLNVRYVYGDDRIAQRRPTASGEKVRWYLHDGQMSTRQLVDETGVVTDHYTYDTFGGEVAKHGSTTNAFRYTGEQLDSASGFYYLRARWYAPTQGRFLTRDPFGGFTQDPMSLHKYLYANANPVNNIDPSGNSLVSTIATVSIIASIGAALGVGFGALANYAQGSPLGSGALDAALLGAGFALLASASLILAGLLAAYGIFVTGGLVYRVFSNAMSTGWQRAAALALLGIAIAGGVFAARGLLVRTPQAEAQVIRADAQPQPSIRNVPRLAQDIAHQRRYPTPPPPNGGSGYIGKSPAQNAALSDFVAWARANAQDVRVGQEQVNAAGVRVGKNKPDLQFTWRGLRHYFEWDRASSPRGIPHGERIKANDPDGIVFIWTLD